MNTSARGDSGLGDNLTCLTTGPPMMILTESENCLTFSGQYTEGIIAEASVSRIQPQITPLMLQQIALLLPTRIVKILEVREQLARGTYHIDERLDAILDRLLADIKT